MAKPKWLLPAGLGAAAAIILIIVALTAFRGGEEALAAEDVEQKIISMYGGEVKDIQQDGNVYRVQLSRIDGEFLAIVDSDGGAIISLEKTGDTELIPEGDIKAKLAERYGAEPAGLTLKDGIYSGKVEKDTHITDVEIDASTGDIMNEEVTDKAPAEQAEEPAAAEKPAAPKPDTNQNQSKQNQNQNAGNPGGQTGNRGNQNSNSQPAKTVRLTENEAAVIALREVRGELDDVDYEESDDGGYYIVEIEAGDMDAEVQIHAITGRVMSVLWDD
ncbi:PepSY domain-containing protein [Bhargavaea cecembensis]|uniref:PepSY domain-containing protein n=1 Tax=Bhargavaea cecembensis TaxID=394098 RepID=UPI0006948640|nr:PepSY domain-containing protein [Bhargavaea cecembensis]